MVGFDAPEGLRARLARRAPALSLVALLHLLVLLIAWQMKLAAPREATAPRASSLRLIPDPSANSAAARSRATPPPPSSLMSSELPPQQRFAITVDVEPWLNSAAPSPSSTQTPTTADADAPQSYGRVSLDGAAHLPAGPASGPARVATKPSREVLRGSLANPAVMDPRSNSPRPSMEERIALDLNPDLCLKEERQADGTIRRYLAKRKEMSTAAQAYTSQKTAKIMACQ